MAEHWMQQESERIEKSGKKGIFKRAAERAGMSTRSYAEKKKHAGGVIGKRANEALNMMNSRR